jgi:CheY-like chemotaxis protein
VLATTHTGDAVSGLRRLIDLELAATRLAESLDVVISLRLVRKLCDHCARDFEEEEDGKSREAQLARVLGVLPRRRAIGCKECAGTGYQGQLPLPEVLVMTDELREFLHTEPTDAEFTRAAQASGMRTFSEVGLERVREGDTTIEELERVLNIVPTREETPSSIGSILVVDDDEDERLLITTILEDIGFHVVPAGGGAEAEALLRRHDREFSLALVDLLMPEMDGLTLLSSIRSTLSTHSLPVVVVTSSSDPGDELRLLEAGADDYVMKPVSKERLDARVRAVLRRAGVHLEVRSTEHDGASHTGEEAADPE